ncbi:MAG: FAD-dependent oxidoreductase [Bacteroidia bacterium]|nr:FAD-dependent oxidoreductase [Bacteroidia bacterium]MDW8345444.1 NAD(P)/FAD-dependent oxidoreductase [Bacteroidia bacterium]
MKRRDFVKNTGLLLTSAALSGYPTTIFGKNKKGKVLILGAGLSGLSAAYLLTRSGYTVTLLEARSRAGGRVFTYSIQDNLTVELGAEWVGASHERILALCKELGLSLQEHRFKEEVFIHGSRRQLEFQANWTKKYENLLSAYRQMSEKEKQKLDSTDWWRYLVNNGIEEEDLLVKELLDSTDFGESIRFVSADMALGEYAESSPNNEMDFKVVGGNSKLIEAFVQKVGTENIKLEHIVTKVEQGKFGIKVTCANGNSFTADLAICTLPTYAISRIEWLPHLPEAKQKAIQALQYARIYKNQLLYSERFWQRENFAMVTDLLGHYFFHTTQKQNYVQGVLTSYSTGDKAMVLSSIPESARKTSLENDINTMLNANQKVQKYVGYYWGSDKFTQGAYAIYGKEQWYSIRPILKKSFGNVLFAGEHVADWQGFMEGAINTGEEAAQAILT